MRKKFGIPFYVGVAALVLYTTYEVGNVMGFKQGLASIEKDTIDYSLTLLLTQRDLIREQQELIDILDKERQKCNGELI